MYIKHIKLLEITSILESHDLSVQNKNKFNLIGETIETLQDLLKKREKLEEYFTVPNPEVETYFMKPEDLKHYENIGCINIFQVKYLACASDSEKTQKKRNFIKSIRETVSSGFIK